MSFWKYLVFTGIRVAGLREWKQAHFDANISYFPTDFMDTTSGRNEFFNASESRVTTLLNYPPGKRKITKFAAKGFLINDIFPEDGRCWLLSNAFIDNGHGRLSLSTLKSLIEYIEKPPSVMKNVYEKAMLRVSIKGISRGVMNPGDGIFAIINTDRVEEIKVWRRLKYSGRIEKIVSSQWPELPNFTVQDVQLIGAITQGCFGLAFGCSSASGYCSVNACIGNDINSVAVIVMKAFDIGERMPRPVLVDIEILA